VEEGRDISDPSPEDGAVLEAQPATPEEMAWPVLGPWADLPRGSGFGECLHRVLEQIDYESVLPCPALQAVVHHELRRAGLDERWADPLLAAIQQMLGTPFGGELGRLRPADLNARTRMNELHFDLSLDHVRAADLARAFVDHPGGAFGEAYATALSQLPVNHCGFLTGSIDLVFPAPATKQWWVLDWKSNWLGRRDGQGHTLSCGPGDYGADALQSLMASHHYPLQAHLYLVALHRYLAWRLPAYCPEQHLGGYAYVFVRGTPGEAGWEVLPSSVPGMVVERPPLGRLLALDRALGTAPSGWEPGLHP
jgi:exodeoxyribonuclease V beta subunit